MKEITNMSTINGYERFEKLMADFVPKFMNLLLSKNWKILIFFNTKVAWSLLYSMVFSEISNSLDTLRLIELFIKANPPEENGINYSNYLTYHVHNYLQRNVYT